ncbi:CAP domain-containing protein [Microcoleus sp. F6_B4]
MAVDYLSSVEQSVLDEINLARTNPSGYADILAQRRPYYQGNLVNIPGQVSRLTNEGVAALDEAIGVLRSTSPLPALSPSRGMSLAAKDHVNDIGPKGLVEHRGTDGSDTPQRIDRYGDPQGRVGETIDFGANTGRQIVIDFLVDDGVPSRGHRDNILGSSFRFAGISVGSHAQYGTMAVIDFADGYKEAFAPPTPVPTPTPAPVPIAPSSNTGSDGNQTVLGTAGSDTLRGGSGTYTLYAGKGDDVLLGSESNDGSVIYAYGGSGNDILVDGFGNDILIGGKGDDYFIGTDGIDTFVGSSGSDTFAFVSDGLAIIPDFDPASDFIELLGDLKGSRVLVTRNTSNSIGVFVSTNGGSSFDLNVALLTNYTGDIASVSRRIIGGT